MQKTSLLLAALTVAVIGVQGCCSKEDDSKVRAAIEARNKEYGAAVAKGDAAAVTALYTATAVLMPPNMLTVSGHDAIQGVFKTFIESGIKGLELTTTEVEGHRDSADEEGTFKVLGDGGKVLDTGKYIVVWKRENDNWFLHRDIWNSNNPPPPPPAPAPAAAEALPAPTPVPGQPVAPAAAPPAPGQPTAPPPKP